MSEIFQHRTFSPRFQKGVARLTLLLAAITILGLAGYLVFKSGTPEESPAVAKQPAPAAPTAPPVPPAPDIPQASEEVVEEPRFELPDLERSDPVLRAELAELSDAEEFNLWLQTDNLIPKSAALIDSVSQGVLPRKLLPINPPTEKFSALVRNQRLWMDEASYDRYDRLTQLLTAIDPDALANTFHLFRPLLEKAYADLGHPAEDMDNSLIRAIDQALATPDIRGPVELVQESVLYQFADPALESLPPIQKQLLRMGPDNAKKLKSYLRDLRKQLLAAETGAADG